MSHQPGTRDPRGRTVVRRTSVRERESVCIPPLFVCVCVCVYARVCLLCLCFVLFCACICVCNAAKESKLFLSLRVGCYQCRRGR